MSFEKNIATNILIVGGGLTGSVAASLIKNEAVVNIEIWERMDRIGGRYQTYRSSSTPKCSVDCGAQYVSVSLDSIRSQAKFYDELLEKEILMPLGQKIENFKKLSETKTIFVAPGGTDSLVAHFLKKADCSVHLQHEVAEINLKEEERVWEVKTADAVVRTFDVVILTIPVPEVLKLGGNFLSISQDDDVKVAMEQVKYSPRIAAALIYDEPVKYLEDLPTAMKYFPDDDILHFMSVDNKKREKSKEVPGIILQSTTSFAKKCSNLNEGEIKKLMLEHIKCLMPELPDPAFVKVFLWTYSMLTEPYVDTPGCVVINDHPCLISGGDSYTESSFNGCITSAVIIVEELLKRVKFLKGHHHGRRRSS
ncbi:Renalase [Araneus ventricosus]|uniref:Renalase n=1 Tax=Araneus ventricosus TaxID=182803 RepID=A0A4Y2HXH9_ARAVE|nr:Renalase [Araneus ventricosus]